MSERIDELAKQAWEYAEENSREPYVDIYDTCLEKFAELIVRECADIALEQKKWVEDQEVFNHQDERWNRARIQQSQRIADKVKQHFGITE